MNTPLSPKDYELLSAYLDNACSLREKTLVEKRLQKDPEFVQALREFKHARRLMRALPLRRAPRNFTLSSSQIPARPQRFFWVPTLNYVAMGATLMLAVVFAGSTLFPLLFGSSRAAAPMAEMAVSESAASTPMIVTWGAPGTSEKSAYGGGMAMDNSTAPSTFLATAPAAGAGSTTGSATEAPMLAQAPSTSATEAPMLAQAPSSSANETPANPILGIAPEEEQGEIVANSEANFGLSSIHLTGLNILEIVLAAAAVFSALAAFLIKKLR